MSLRQRKEIQELLRSGGLTKYGKRRSTAARDCDVVEITATFWSAVAL